MKPVGFYRELCPANALLPSLLSAQGEDISADVSKEVFDFLENGPVIIDYTETDLCVLGCGASIIGTSSIQSNGEWIWRRDLAHYFSVHKISLPVEFVDAAKSGIVRRLSPEEARAALALSWEQSGLI